MWILSAVNLWGIHWPVYIIVGGGRSFLPDNKSQMSFQLVPKSVTLNDLQRRNSPNFAWFLRIRICFGFGPITYTCKLLKITLCNKSSTRNLVFSNVWLMAIFAYVTENECINDRYLRDNDTSSSVVSNDRSSQRTAKCISAKTDTLSRAISLRYISYALNINARLA